MVKKRIIGFIAGSGLYCNKRITPLGENKIMEAIELAEDILKDLVCIVEDIAKYSSKTDYDSQDRVAHNMTVLKWGVHGEGSPQYDDNVEKRRFKERHGVWI